MIEIRGHQRCLAAAAALVITLAAICIGGCVDGSSSPDVLAIGASEGGTTSPAPGIHQYAEGDVVTLSASPSAGYTFSGWTGDTFTVEDPTAATTRITINGNRYITAEFVQNGQQSYFSTNQKWIEGFYADPEDLDIEDVGSVFWHVFSRLPDEVIVYPSENYYYFMLFVDGHQFWGNIRLAAGYRDEGEVSFAYFEFDEFASPYLEPWTRSKMLTAADGVVVEKVDRFTYDVHHRGKTVRFNLHQIPQEPPKLFALRENEVSVERTFDESGYQFFLLFNEEKDYFFWVLNEENGVPDVLTTIEGYDDVLVGKRSGFAFWEDDLGRKVLASIRQHSVTRNDYYDGPFDQLADNYAQEVRIREYMIKATPAYEGRINEYGYFIKDQYGNPIDRPMRVALSTYQTYYTQNQFLTFIEQAKASDDPYQYISRRGVPSTPSSGTPAATPTPTGTP